MRPLCLFASAQLSLALIAALTPPEAGHDMTGDATTVSATADIFHTDVAGYPQYHQEESVSMDEPPGPALLIPGQPWWAHLIPNYDELYPQTETPEPKHPPSLIRRELGHKEPVDYHSPTFYADQPSKRHIGGNIVAFLSENVSSRLGHHGQVVEASQMRPRGDIKAVAANNATGFNATAQGNPQTASFGEVQALQHSEPSTTPSPDPSSSPPPRPTSSKTSTITRPGQDPPKDWTKLDDWTVMSVCTGANATGDCVSYPSKFLVEWRGAKSSDQAGCLSFGKQDWLMKPGISSIVLNPYNESAPESPNSLVTRTHFLCQLFSEEWCRGSPLIGRLGSSSADDAEDSTVAGDIWGPPYSENGVLSGMVLDLTIVNIDGKADNKAKSNSCASPNFPEEERYEPTTSYWADLERSEVERVVEEAGN